MTRLNEGAKAPSFTLPNQSGDKVSLGDFKGQRVVLYFYPADDTPGCTKEACQFNEALSAFTKSKVRVIGISPDAGDSHVSFRNKYGLKFDLLSDPEKKVMEKYGAFGDKVMYGKKVRGVIRSTFLIGADGRIERTWYNVRADGHAAESSRGALAGVVTAHRAKPVPEPVDQRQDNHGDDWPLRVVKVLADVAPILSRRVAESTEQRHPNRRANCREQRKTPTLHLGESRRD